MRTRKTISKGADPSAVRGRTGEGGLSPETILTLPRELRDRANYQRWQDDQNDQDGQEEDPTSEHSSEQMPASPEQMPLVALKVPDASERLLTRLVMLYNRLWFLSSLPDNDRGGAFAGNWWLCDKIRMPDGDRPNVATVRRWIAVLEDCGWVRRVKKSKDRIIECLATPAQIVQILPRFARYLRGVLRGIRAALPLLSEREINNYKRERATPKRERRPLTAGEERVVVQAAKAGMIREDAEAVVRGKGVGALEDALAVLRHQREKAAKSGKERIEDSGAYLAGLVKRAIAGTLSLPKAILEARAVAERKAERERAAANRVMSAATLSEAPVTAVEAPVATAPQERQVSHVSAPEPLVDAETAAIAALPPERIADLETRAREHLETVGGAIGMMVKKVKDWRSGTGRVLRGEMFRLLQEGTI